MIKKLPKGLSVFFLGLFLFLISFKPCFADTPLKGSSLDTAIGLIPIDSYQSLIGFFLKWGVGVGGGIAFLLMIYAGFIIMTSQGDPKRLAAGQELLTSAVMGLMLLIFSVFILKLIGVDILQLPFVN